MTAIKTGVSLADMATGPWTKAENDLIVADYFAMLASDLAGRRYNKAEHNRRLRNQIGRGRGSIEYKHQNISAVLKGLGESWISGYRPAFNFQMSLVDAVARWLHRNPEFRTPAPFMELPITLCFLDVTFDIKRRGSARIERASVPEVPCATARAGPLNVGGSQQRSEPSHDDDPTRARTTAHSQEPPAT